MTDTNAGSESWGDVPTMECRVCEVDVPAGAFCGLCGAHLSHQRGDGPQWLRIRAYGAAPGEHVLRLSVVSSLFPHLPQRSRTPFRVGLAIVLLALVVFALLRWQAPLIAVSALGLPLLFQLYLQESDVYHDLPIRLLALTAALGVGFGVGWALLTGGMVARSYGLALDAGMTWERVLRDGLAIPLGGAILMLLPAVLVRAFRPPTRESLDGFLIGGLSAISFTTAATLTRLAPQFATGMVASGRPVSHLLVEAGIRGVAVPLTSAAVGGLIGAALWFTGRADPSHNHRRRALAALGVGVVVVLAVYVGLGFIDLVRLPQGLQLGLHLVVTVIALFALRIGLHLALMHEAHEPSTGEPLLCPHCGHVVPDMAFCPNCGVATRASSRSSRTARRLARPTPTDTPPEGA
jgi:hypothetical protein